jgi:predicted HTH domain antitoxin
MPLSVDMPEDIQTALETKWGDLSQHVRETLAVEGYRQGLLSLSQVRRLLGLSTRWEAQEFIGRRGVPVFDFDPSELDREAALQSEAARSQSPERG